MKSSSAVPVSWPRTLSEGSWKRKRGKRGKKKKKEIRLLTNRSRPKVRFEISLQSPVPGGAMLLLVCLMQLLVYNPGQTKKGRVWGICHLNNRTKYKLVKEGFYASVCPVV